VRFKTKMAALEVRFTFFLDADGSFHCWFGPRPTAGDFSADLDKIYLDGVAGLI
jgi:hypothetical protein